VVWHFVVSLLVIAAFIYVFLFAVILIITVLPYYRNVNFIFKIQGYD